VRRGSRPVNGRGGDARPVLCARRPSTATALA
jgi:hypothetical protein